MPSWHVLLHLANSDTPEKRAVTRRQRLRPFLVYEVTFRCIRMNFITAGVNGFFVFAFTNYTYFKN